MIYKNEVLVEDGNLEVQQRIQRTQSSVITKEVELGTVQHLEDRQIREIRKNHQWIMRRRDERQRDTQRQINWEERKKESIMY